MSTSEDLSMRQAIALFAANLSSDPGDQNVLKEARERGWIDENDELTKSGREVIEALSDQDQTRSVFRLR